MADSYTSLELRELLLVEDLCNKALTLDCIQFIAIECRYTTSLLATVLQSVQTVVCEVWSIVNAKDTKDTTLLV